MASASIPTLVSPPSSPPPPLTPLVSSSNDGPSKNFAHSISQKLNAKNYLLWIQQVEPVIRSHHLEGYIVNQKILQKYASIEDRNANKVTCEYSVWHEQDQFLLVVAIHHLRPHSSASHWMPIVVETLGSDSIALSILTCAKVCQVCNEIQNLSLDNRLYFGLSFACSDAC